MRDRLPSDLAQTEPFGGALDGEAFVDLLRTRWSRFAAEEAQRPGFVSLECALIQNPVTELRLFAGWPEPAITAAVASLLHAVGVLNPALVLLRTADIAATIEAVTAARSDAAWREAAEACVADSPVGADRGWGFVDYLRWRAEFADRPVAQLAVDTSMLTSRPDQASWQLQRNLDQAVDRWLA